MSGNAEVNLDKPGEEIVEEMSFDDAFAAEAAKKDGIEEVIVEDDPAEVIEEPGPAAASVAAVEENPFEGWPQEAIDQVKAQQEATNKLQHRIDSDNGRVNAFQRQVSGLQGEIAQLQEKPGDQPSNEEITAAMATDEGWDQFTDDYPEIAKAIDSRLESRLGSQEEKINTTLAPVIERQQVEAQTEANGAVAGVYPAWQEEVQKEDFANWMSSQPAAVQGLADSDDVADATSLIGLYDTHRMANGLPSLKTDHIPDGEVVEKTAEDDLAARRNQQLEDGTTLPSRTARIDPDSEGGDDFGNAFDMFAKRKDAARQA